MIDDHLKALPEILVPFKGGDRYKLVVFKVLSVDPLGIPNRLQLILDHQTVELKGDEEFMTGYIPLHMTKPKKEGE